MYQVINQISNMYCSHGAARYGREAVTQQQHALQCAHLAELAGAPAELVAAALLHDLGHLPMATPVLGEPEKAAATDHQHQLVATPFLRATFGDAVTEPIRLHVDAKRYLCRVDASYWSSLSPESKCSLELQGGVFSDDEALVFVSQPFAADAVALRRWDDLAKNPVATPPAWHHYVTVLESVAHRPLGLV